MSAGQLIVSGPGKGEGGMINMHTLFPLQPNGSEEGSQTNSGRYITPPSPAVGLSEQVVGGNSYVYMQSRIAHHKNRPHQVCGSLFLEQWKAKVLESPKQDRYMEVDSSQLRRDVR